MESIPHLYCTPKTHKEGYPLRPIVDYIGFIGYNTSRALADILSPLVGKTGHHVPNSKEFAEEINQLTMEKGETLVSFDVVSLFTNTPINQSLEVVKDRLNKDSSLKDRTNLTPNDTIELLGFILTTTYFQFDGQVYRQKFGAAMGSPVSPIIANLFMEDLEQTVLSTAPPTIKPRLWKRYVDDVLAFVKEDSVDQLKNHLNQADITGSIKFTHEFGLKEEVPHRPISKFFLTPPTSSEDWCIPHTNGQGPWYHHRVRGCADSGRSH